MAKTYQSSLNDGLTKLNFEEEQSVEVCITWKKICQ